MLQWLKQFMPRGIYGRAALIVAVPFLALQVTVSLVFIQRHFEDVTRQMVTTTSAMLAHVLAVAEDQGVDTAIGTAARPMGITLSRVEVEDIPDRNPKLWYDISGFTIISRLEELYDLRAIDLSDLRRVDIWVARGEDIYQLGFARARVSARNPHQLLVVLLVAGVLMIIVVFAFLRNQLRPIRRLARVAAAFGRGRSDEYYPSGATEVRAAGNAFLDMRARIERQIEQRTLLLSGVSHDLRTPLTRMRLGLSMMEAEPEVLALRADVEDMGAMIDAFLDFARVSSGEEAEPTNLADLLNASIDGARRAGVPVEVAGELPEISLPLRPMGMRRTIDNLLVNAGRYGSRVQVSCLLLASAVRIRVEDNGPGIPPENRDEVTRPFVRLDEARGQNKGGSVGLGLAIAADTVRRHGGTLRLTESEELGGLAADIVIAR